QAEGPLKVASLSTVLSDIAQNVGGGKVEVEWILKPDKDPHAFQPSPSDVKTLSQAKIVLASGKGIEGYLSKLEQSAGPDTRFITVSDSIPSLKMKEAADHDHDHGGAADHGGLVEDPHWWHSVKNAKIATKVIRDALAAADPANADFYKANAAAYQVRLDALAKWVRGQVALLSADKRKLVTSHDAFQYFARENGFTIYAVEGLSTSDQPTSHEVAELIQTIKAQGVKAVFAESAVNPKVVQEITQETGAKLGGELLADGLNGKEASTYEDMVRVNVTTIVNALK
ncbi:MAG TPA: zinc ABC transporter substrate-binding protein, partial [Chthoniobacterales bacterium]